MSLFNRNKNQPVRQPKPGTDDQGYVFRRSRTLTGTTSPNVTAGAESRSQLKTARLQAHELHQVRKRILRILFVLVAGIAILSYLVASYISTVHISYPQPGTQPPSVVYQQTIGDYFSQRPLERFSFALNAQQLSSALTAAHPELLSVDIDKGVLGHGTNFILQFRKPILVWTTAGQQFYVDNQGIAFQYDHFGGKYVSVSDQSGLSPSQSGGTVASNSFINFLGKMVGAVNVGGRGMVTDIIIPAATREVDLKLQGRGYPIKTHTDRDPLQQAQDILNTLKWFDDHKITPQYVDVRVAGKAYYK